MVFNRISVGTAIVRFFYHQRDAVQAANALTATFQEPYAAILTVNGWLIENAATKRLRDIDGLLPESVDIGDIRA